MYNVEHWGDKFESYVSSGELNSYTNLGCLAMMSLTRNLETVRTFNISIFKSKNGK